MVGHAKKCQRYYQGGANVECTCGLDTVLKYIGKARYDREGQMIWTEDNQRLLDIRGWGHLSSTLGENKAIDLQDGIGEYITELINNNG